MAETWPIAFLPPRNVTRRIMARTTAGTVSASGFTQRVGVPASAWVIEYDGIPVTTLASLREWDRLEAVLDGGAGQVIVQLPVDGMGEANGIVAGVVTAGSHIITIVRAGGVVAGQHFSILNRCYRIASIMDVVGDANTIIIRPLIREEVPDLSVADFADLKVLCRLASDDEMNLSIGPDRLAVGAVRFVEDPN